VGKHEIVLLDNLLKLKQIFLQKKPNKLKKHKATMHGIGNALTNRADKPIKCPFCSMSFKSKGGLQEHSEFKHDTEIEVEVENDIDMGTEVQTMEIIIAS
jgi:hypothetical protein